MRRRDVIVLLGGAAAAWPFGARATVMPVVGFLHGASAAPHARHVAAFRHALEQADFVEGQSVAIEYRWAEGRFDRLPALARNLVRCGSCVTSVAGPHGCAELYER
jgi:putative ABC transport system substrate-binding protein